MARPLGYIGFFFNVVKGNDDEGTWANGNNDRGCTRMLKLIFKGPKEGNGG
jgi:hypothetical protein